ncbi:unnamed protein product, partial [Acanthoscelides obtectus]
GNAYTQAYNRPSILLQKRFHNLGVHDCTAEQSHMFLWTENQAKRGSDEVASMLFKFLEDKKDVDHHVVFTVNYPGYTHLPSDRDFALIEKRHRKYAPEVYSPERWHKIINDANNKNPFKVTVMQQEYFWPTYKRMSKRTRPLSQSELLKIADNLGKFSNGDDSDPFEASESDYVCSSESDSSSTSDSESIRNIQKYVSRKKVKINPNPSTVQSNIDPEAELVEEPC